MPSNSPAPAPTPTSGPVSAPVPTPGMFTSCQSAATFAGGAGGITLVWKVLGAVFPALANNKLVPVVLTIALCGVLYWLSPTGATPKEKWLGFVYAVLNSFAIAAAILGIDASIAPANPN